MDLCAACLENPRGNQALNLPHSRYMCSECVDLIGCYVCNGKPPAEDPGLLLCEGCGWRGAHYRCLGLKSIPKAEWFCFRCEDPLQRQEQAQAMPVLDVRVHEDYLTTATKKKETSLRKRVSLNGASDISAGETPLKRRVFGGDPVKRMPAKPGMRLAVHVKNTGGLRCVSCVGDVESANFCSLCGETLRVSADAVDGLKKNARQTSPDGVSVPVMKSGAPCLCQIVLPSGKYMALALSEDESELLWYEEEKAN